MHDLLQENVWHSIAESWKHNHGSDLVEDGDQVWVVPTAGQMQLAGKSRREDEDDVTLRLAQWGVLSLKSLFG